MKSIFRGFVCLFLVGTGILLAQQDLTVQWKVGAAMVAMEDYFSQHEDGLLSDEQFSQGRATFRERLREPGLRAFWLKQREAMTKAAPRYCAFIDSLCTDEPMMPSDLDLHRNGKS
jgi:hypothetical protein